MIPSHYKRILCPTDFSSFSRRAFEYAITVARLYGAEIETLHVFPVVAPVTGDLTYTATIVRLDENMSRTLSEDLHRFVEPAKAAGVATKTLLVEGDPPTFILGRTRKVPIDLVVMGTHGRRGFDRWIMGSVAHRVLRKAACPVLTVPPGSEAGPRGGLPVLRRILCALDLTKDSRGTLEHAVSLARASNATLIVHHVMEGSHPHEMHPERPGEPAFLDEMRQHVEARARGVEETLAPGEIGDIGGVERIVTRGRAYEEVLRISAERQADLIVMGVHGRKRAELPFFGSTALHVVEHATCPVLTVRPR